MVVCCCTLRFILKLNSASAAFTFGRGGGILSENRKDGKVTVHSAKNTTKFDATVGRSANRADQLNLGVATFLEDACLYTRCLNIGEALTS